MTKTEVESFLGSSFFNALISSQRQKYEWEYINILFSQINDGDHSNEVKSFSEALLEKYYDVSGENEDSYFKDKYREIICHAVLKAFIVNDLLKYFCEEENLDKIVKTVERKQFDSKIIKQTEHKIMSFLFLLNLSSASIYLLSNIIFLDTKRMVEEYNEAFIVKEMEPLRKRINTAASGVNTRCYPEFMNKHYEHISPDLNDYIREKHGYDNLGSEWDYDDYRASRYYLSYALINDSKIWDKNRNICDFLVYVEKYSSLEHAKKIIDFAFSEICKDAKFKFLYDHKLPFYLYDIEKVLLKNSKIFFNKKYYNLLNVELTDEDSKGFLYPLYEGYEEKINIGKKVFKEFLADAYKDEYEKVLEILSDASNKIQDDEDLDDGRFNREITFKEHIDFEMMGYFADEYNIRKFLSMYYDNFMDNESILSRFYYRIYLINKFAKENSKEYIYEDLYSLFEMIDHKYNTSCKYSIDLEFRDDNYNELKKILKKYGFEIDDKYKSLYIISLLDRKYASIDEASHFAELEQFGDAIYDLAADNILFYDEENYYCLTTGTHIELVKADAQVKVAKNLGIDKIYISKLHHSLNQKYEGYEEYRDTDEYPTNNQNCPQKYIADSLEMIIGVLAKEFGVQRALDFATKIILETNPEYHYPNFIENTDYISMIKSHNSDYLGKVFAQPEAIRSSDYYEEYNELWLGLGKVIKIAIIGNDTKEKRKLIANNSHWILTVDGDIKKYHYISYYLFNGIEATISTFKDIVTENYIKYKDKY